MGVVFGESAAVLNPLGDLFISAIKMLVAPLIFCAIVVSITALGSEVSLKRLSFKTLAMGAMEIFDVIAERSKMRDSGRGDLTGLVRGIIENLNL